MVVVCKSCSLAGHSATTEAGDGVDMTSAPASLFTTSSRQSRQHRLLSRSWMSRTPSHGMDTLVCFLEGPAVICRPPSPILSTRLAVGLNCTAIPVSGPEIMASTIFLYVIFLYAMHISVLGGGPSSDLPTPKLNTQY
jgi:hypothetical protein